MINQCKKVHRRDDNTGETLYEGQYVLTRPLVHGIKYNGLSEIKENYQNCMAWCIETDEYRLGFLVILLPDIKVLITL